MSAPVVLWRDYVSPYAFVAKAAAYAVETDYEITLQWLPYTLDVSSYRGSVEQRDPITGGACAATWMHAASPTSRA